VQPTGTHAKPGAINSVALIQVEIITRKKTGGIVVSVVNGSDFFVFFVVLEDNFSYFARFWVDA
jgi:hypothetical protein